jgi:hypothetical protein
MHTPSLIGRGEIQNVRPARNRLFFKCNSKFKVEVTTIGRRILCSSLCLTDWKLFRGEAATGIEWISHIQLSCLSVCPFSPPLAELVSPHPSRFRKEAPSPYIRMRSGVGGAPPFRSLVIISSEGATKKVENRKRCVIYADLPLSKDEMRFI